MLGKSTGWRSGGPPATSSQRLDAGRRGAADGDDGIVFLVLVRHRDADGEVRTPARSKVDGAVDFLCEKTGQRSEKLRPDVGILPNHEREALVHRVVDGKLQAAAVTKFSGEQFPSPRSATEGEKGMRR